MTGQDDSKCYGESYLDEHGTLLILFAVLVQKLGGEVTVTQKEIDEVAFCRLIEDKEPNSTEISFKVAQRAMAG
jgi:hypothetical protein